MNLRRLKLFVIIGHFLLMALPGLVLADPNDPSTWNDANLIARIMREYQGRYIYVKGKELPYMIYGLVKGAEKTVPNRNRHSELK